MEGFTIIDGGVALVIVLSALLAYSRGLVREGLAYVDELSAEQMREYRGTLTSPGRDSPFREPPSEGQRLVRGRVP